MSSKHNGRARERGNVLFLILIAVALFAALSYAVTQSTRSGGGDASKETSLVNVAQLLQVPAVYRATVQRMMISQGINGGDIVGTPPAYFSGMTANMIPRNIYHPQGGAMPYPIPARELMEDTSTVWAINSEHEVKGVGTTSTSGAPEIDHVELMAILPGIKKSVCEAINKKLGIAGMPQSIMDSTMTASADPGTYMENGGVNILGNNSTDSQLVGKTEGCVYDGSAYIFYAVIQER